ncbi:MAG: hypothetical protein ACE5HP_07135 [Gemmatimonadota bacterium]
MRKVERRAGSGGLLLCALALGGCGGEGRQGGEPEAPADSAQLLADRVMEALGGEEAWESVRFLTFRWVVARGERTVGRTHAWDRRTGRYRVEYDGREAHHTAIFNVREVRRDSLLGKIPAGRAWRDAQEVTGAAADSALARAYSIFINDSYWLLMPFKWRDPGVHLAYEGRQLLSDRQEYAIVHLTFEPDLGVTEDEYWAYVDPVTGIMTAWRYHLQNQEEPGPVILWRDWRRVGPIRLAADREWPDGETRLYFEDLGTAAEVPEGAFDPPGG